MSCFPSIYCWAIQSQVGWEAKVQGCTRTYISIAVLVDQLVCEENI